MNDGLRRIGVVALLALLMNVMVLQAQDDNADADADTPTDAATEIPTDTPTVYGSGIVMPVMEALAASADVDVDANIVGTPAGLASLCAGEADLAVGTRAITADEDARCVNNAVAYRELLIGHAALALVGHPQDTGLARCLTQADINLLFAPSSVGQITDWAQTDVLVPTTPQEGLPEVDPADAEPEATPEATPEEPEGLRLTVLVPPDDTLAYLLLDDLVAGEGLRADAQTANVDDLLATVAETPGAIGAALLADANASDVPLNTFALEFESSGCVPPNATTIEEDLYGAALPFYLYVAEDSLPSVARLLDGVANTQQLTATLRQLGYTAPSAQTINLNAQVLAGEADARPFSEDISTFSIPTNLFGEVAIGGAPHLNSIISTAISQLEPNQPNLTISQQWAGETAGIRRLCNGELDIAIATDTTLTENQAAACDANDIDLYAQSVGARAVVMLVNEANSTAFCLTTEQVATLWGAPSQADITNWQDLSDSQSDLDLVLLGEDPEASGLLEDLLFVGTDGSVLPIRADVEAFQDPLYRAAAVGNVEGAITYMSWPEYQRVQRRGQQRIQLVSVDGGSGCVVPSTETITDGTYPLSQQAAILVPQSSLADVPVQSVLWQIFGDVSFLTLGNEGYVDLGTDDAAAFREELERAYALAEDARANPDETALPLPEATPEVETTPEATPEVASE